MLAENPLDYFRLGDVVQWCPGAVSVDVIHFVGAHLAFLKRQADGARGTIYARLGDVRRVRSHSEAANFGEDVRTPTSGALVLLQQQNSRAFAHHEALAVGGEGPAS